MARTTLVDMRVTHLDGRAVSPGAATGRDVLVLVLVHVHGANVVD